MRVFPRLHKLLLKYITKVRANDAETGYHFFEVDRLRIHIPYLHLGTLLLDIYKPVFWHFEVCLCVPMDAEWKSGQAHEDECVPIDEDTYCGSVLQCQEELEEILVEDEAWN